MTTGAILSPSPPLPFPAAGAHLGLRTWRSASGRGSLQYAEVSGYRVAAGEPRASARDFPDLFAEFEADCRRAGRKPVYFGLPGSALEFLDAGRGRWHAGDLPVFNLDRWRESRGAPESIPSSIAAQVRRARNQGVTVRRWPVPPEAGSPLRQGLRDCLRDWLRDKPLPPLRFVTTPFLFDPWPEDGVFIAEKDGRVCGFLAGSSVLFRDLWRVDAVGRATRAPNGCSELLVREAFAWAADRGFERATLGLAPLARRSGHVSSGWIDRALDAVRETGAPGYSFAGLEAFKAKFRPDAWRPLFCVSRGGKVSVRDLVAVARAFAGGSLLRYGAETALWKMGRRLRA